MSRNYEHPPITAYGEVTNDAASNQLIPAKTGRYIHIQRINFSVYQAGGTGDGLFRIQTTEGNEIYTINAGSVKDITIDGGQYGFRLPLGEGIDIVTYNDSTEQASVSVAVTAYASKFNLECV